jgi:serine/threonine protein kinase
MQYVGNNELIKDVFLQLLDGIAWLHQLGIAHRDIKPENIVCSEGGTRLRIVDFGLATSETTSTEFGCGSTFYIAPGMSVVEACWVSADYNRMPR